MAIINNRISICSQMMNKVFQIQNNFSFSAASDQKGKAFSNRLPEKWHELIDKTDKIVGFKTSSMLLRYFLNESLVDLAKSFGSVNSGAKTLKNILIDSAPDNKPWGLIILLLSTSTSDKMPSDQTKSVAEIVELIKVGFRAHDGIENTNKSPNKNVAIHNNKVYMLLGDYFITNAHYSLAELRNLEVYYTISTALKVLSESAFIGERDVQNKPMPNAMMQVTNNFEDFDLLSLDVTLSNARKEWTVRCLFNGVDLLGRGCQSIMMLNKQTVEVQHRAYNFGCHLGLAFQAAADFKMFTSENTNQFCLVSAPVLFALEENHNIYRIINKAKNDVNEVDYEDLKLNILKTNAVKKTKMLYEEHAKKATMHIESFGENESVDMIKKFIQILCNLQ